MENSIMHESGKSIWYDTVIGLTVSLLLLICFYPQFLLFLATPMHANGWELSDPSVSWANFKPSFRVFQYELYNNFNVFWSSLRTMGMPVLANDIQAAPLFPLTLLLSWLDEDIFWNLFVVCRLTLMGLGTFLLARRVFDFRLLPAVFFIITFVYALYVMRWMNNPWQNGLLSGIWYLYFLCLLLKQQKGLTWKRFGVFSGLVVSVYMMVTCGFPEASVMSAIMVVLIYPPLFIVAAAKKTIRWKPFFLDLLIAHIIGFALSSAQIFAIIELLAASESHRFVGLRQYGASDMLPFFAENLTRFNASGPSLFSDSRTYLGLVPLLLFCLGLATSIRRRGKSAGQIGALLCGLFILFKMFAIGPEWFNDLVAKPPILRESYFYVYFFSLFLWFFSYFSALGLQRLITIPPEDLLQRNRRWKMGLPLLSVIILVLFWGAAVVVTGEGLWQLLLVERRVILLKVTAIFSIASIVIILLPYVAGRKVLTATLATFVLFAVFLENYITLPKDFYAWENRPNEELEQVLQSLAKNDIPVVESRIADRNGTYVSAGLATIDTGATPLLPRRTQTFRTNFFKTIRAGHLSIESPKSRYSWGITATNLRTLDRYYGGGEEVLPDWSEWQRGDKGEIHLDKLAFNGEDLSPSQTIMVSGGVDDYFYFRGWAVGDQERGLEETSVFLVFSNDNNQVTVPTRKAVRHDVARHLGNEAFIYSGWDGYLSAVAIPSGTYTLSVRFADKRANIFYEVAVVENITLRNKNDWQKRPFLFGVDNPPKIFLGVLEQYYIYLDPSALPRAYVASRCTPFDSVKDVVQEFRTTTSFRLGNVFLEDLSEGEESFCNSYSRGSERVPIRQDAGSELYLEKVEGPAIIVVNDNIYPGWQAFNMDTGDRLAIKPGNITFRTLLLPEEKSYTIVFRYRPFWLPVAILLMSSGLLLFFAYLGLTVKARRGRTRE